MKKLFFLVMAVMFGLTATMNANAATTSAMTTSSVAAASSSSDQVSIQKWLLLWKNTRSWQSN